MDNGENRITDAIGLLASNPGLVGGILSALGSGGGTSAPDPGLLSDLPALIEKLKPLLSRLSGTTGGVSGGELLGTLSSLFGAGTGSGKRIEEVIAEVTDTEEPSEQTNSPLEGSPDGTSGTPVSDLRATGTASAESQSTAIPSAAFKGVLPGKPGKIHFPHDKRLSLLVALKPYLSPRRAAAVDTMLRFGKIGELLEGLMPENGGK